MRFYTNNFLFSGFLLFFFLILSLTLSLEFDSVGLTFIINLFFTIFFIALSLQRMINTLLFFYIFNLIFMVFIPWIHYSENITIWAKIPFSSDEYFFTNIIVFLINIVVFLVYYFLPVVIKKSSDKYFNWKEPSFFISLLICILSFFVVLYSLNFNFLRIFFRGFADDDFEYLELNPFISILSYLSRFLPAFIFLRFINSKNLLKKVLFFSFVLLCAFPTSIPRYMVAFIYLPIFLAYFKSMKKPIYITCVMLFSLFLIFPFLNQFRYFSSDTQLSFLPDKNFFIQGHFDAYQNFMDVMRFDFITYGHQLLGVVFFFIPRVFWENKAVGSGYQLAENNGYFFNNISMPFVAEGFVNFGYLGILFFSIFLGGIMKVIDTLYLTRFEAKDNNYLISTGVFLCASLFFMFRGDLMSSFSSMLAGIIALYVAGRLR
ncbi:O-antigen polymerase [Acinetobacter baumannii]|uniref:O-antigen polymerase n=2 Tax=Acinetobacter baumannii TaxID=470 RepID=UPI0029408272|nr:O-antigen polymerase [Acinetobacter baumannii]MDV4226165.1 oligosaccharide repeat unit polymerase [Acinetobacter baumannii]MDV7619688.1 O-antigen polymerase [Acinetobacter baumannii]